MTLSIGGIAQLGERLHGMQEVSGSIPLTSTSYNEVSVCSQVVFETNHFAVQLFAVKLLPSSI